MFQLQLPFHVHLPPLLSLLFLSDLQTMWGPNDARVMGRPEETFPLTLSYIHPNPPSIQNLHSVYFRVAEFEESAP